MATVPVRISRPGAGQSVTLPRFTVDFQLDLDFDPSSGVLFSRNEDDLVFSFDNGSRTVISQFFVNDSLPAFQLPDGSVVSSSDFLSGSDLDLSTAAGPTNASAFGSGTSYTDEAGSLIGGVESQGYLSEMAAPGARSFATAAMPAPRSSPAAAAPETASDQGDSENDYGGVIQPGQIFSQIKIDCGWVYEGMDGGKHIDGPYTPDFAGMGLSPNSTSEWGAPISIYLEPGEGQTQNDAYLSQIILQTAVAGTFVYGNGQPIIGMASVTDSYGNMYILMPSVGGITIVINSMMTPDANKPVDLSGLGGLYFLPDSGESDAAIMLQCTVYMANETVPFGGGMFTRYITVDAVADKPDYLGGAESDVIFNPYDNDGERPETTTEFDNGVATQYLGGGLLNAEASAVIALGTAQFKDYKDGSEEHFVLIRCENEDVEWSIDTSQFGQGDYAFLVPPADGQLETFWLYPDNTEAAPGAPGATMYYKVNIDNAYLQENDGEVSINLPLTVGPNTEIGEHAFEFKLGAKEGAHPDNNQDGGIEIEYDARNNLAITDADGVNVNVLTFKSAIKVSTGWAYESGSKAAGTDNPSADPSGWNVDPGYTDLSHIFSGDNVVSSAAFIKIEIPDPVSGETIDPWITLKFDSSRGDIYDPAGNKVSVAGSDGISTVTINRADYGQMFGNDGEILFYFVPDPNSDDDSDLVLTYEFSIRATGPKGQSYTFDVSNEIPIVIDAVADAAVVTTEASGESPVFDGFYLAYEAVIHHDASEHQYIIISNPDGLLALGDLGHLARYLSLIDPSVLQVYDNPDPGAARYFDALGPDDIILKITDLEGLDLLDGNKDGNISINIPLEVTDRDAAGSEIDVDVRTAVIEGGGNNPDNWSPEEPGGTPGEYDFSNNIALTENTAEVRMAEGLFTVKEAGDVHEGDRGEQHLYGDAASPEYGTALQLRLEDSYEAINEITFSLSSTDGAAGVEGSLTFGWGSDATAIPGGGGLRLTAELGGPDGDTAYYTKVQIVDANGTLVREYSISPAVTLQELVGAQGPDGLRFIPSGDGDADVTVDFTARVVDLGSGDTITVDESLTIVRDAVADLPVEVNSQVASTKPGYEAVVAGETLTIDVTATFGDYTDGSESHYLFISKEHLADADIGIPNHLRNYFEILQAPQADLVCAQVDGIDGIPGASSSGYFVIKIDPGYLQANNGRVELPLEAELNDTLPPNGQAVLDIKAVAVEYDGFLTQTGVDLGNGNVETDASNNVAVADASSTIHWATLDNDFHLTVGSHVYEGDQPDQHTGDPAFAGGTGLTISTGDPHEVITELEVRYLDADGNPAEGMLSLTVNEVTLDIPSGVTLVLEYDPANPTLCVKVSYTDGGVTHSLDVPGLTLERLTSGGLRYVPDPASDSDADITLSLGAETLETRSGESGHMDLEATIVVDAVADLPVGVSSEALITNPGYDAVVAGGAFTVNVQATFGDYKDGSEAHYLFVSAELLHSINIPSDLFNYFTVLTGTAADAVCAQVDGPGGIPGATSGTYFVIKVDPAYLEANNGKVDLPLEVELHPTLPPDGEGSLDIKAVAVEHEGFLTGRDINGNAEVDAANNVAVADASNDFSWATLENVFDFSVDYPAYENDQPGQNVGDSAPAGGAVLTIAPADDSEVFDTLTIVYQDEFGQPAHGQLVLSAGDDSLNIPSGITLVFEYDAGDPSLCVKVSYIDGGGVTHSLDVPGLTLKELTEQGLRYVPDAHGNDSDANIRVTFTGDTRETASGETGSLPETTIQINVDAVADKPEGDKTEYDYTQFGKDENGEALYNSITDGSAIAFKVEATFKDYEDGSEKHYLFINMRYLADGSLELIDQTTGLPFTGYTEITEPALSALLSQINPAGQPEGSPGLVPDGGDRYMVIEIDPAYLLANGGKVDLTLEATLKDYDDLKDLGEEKALLDMDVKAVAVEHQGYETPLTGGEVTESNNVAITDVGAQFRYDSLQNEFELTTGVAHEGDQPGQHTGDLSPAGGAPIVIVPGDSSEVFTKMLLEYDNSHGNIVLNSLNSGGSPVSIVLPPDVDVVFTFDKNDPTLIIKVEWSKGTFESGTLDIYDADGNRGMTLEDLTRSGLRYVPHAGDNDDADIALTIHAETKETNTGTTGEKTLNGTIVVDAVADRPDADSTLIIANGKGNTVILNEANNMDSFEVKIETVFNDYQDGSEGHYIFVSKEYLSGIEGWPSGVSQLGDADAARILDNAGLSDDYFVLEVSPGYLQANNGALDFTLTAHLDGNALPEEGEQFHVDIKAGAIEHEGYNTPVDGSDLGNGHGQDHQADNNVALVDIGVDLSYARLDNDFVITVGNAYEGDMPGQHVSDLDQAGGAIVGIAPGDSSEVFDTLAFSYNDSEGSLYIDLPTVEAGNLRLALPDGAEISFSYRNDGAGATTCTGVTVTVNGVSTTYTLTSEMSLQDLTGGERMRYIPDTGSQSDDDVTITFSGTSRETATGESGPFTAEAVVKVDAVADRPDARSDVSNPDGYQALACGTPFDLAIKADFGQDVHDGSEKHYLFISKAYLAGLNIPPGLAALSLLPDADAARICAQVDGAGGIPGATSDGYFVIEVSNAWLQANGGQIDLALEGILKPPADLKGQNAYEGDNLTLGIKAVAVEHDGFLTSTEDDLGNGHGYDVDASNNVAVDDASASFTYAALDNVINASAEAAYEGDQKLQVEGDWATREDGAAITIAPVDTSEVFTELTLTYDGSHGGLQMVMDNGVKTDIPSGTRLVFIYDPANPTECVEVQVWRPGDASPSATLNFLDDNNRGISLEDLTSGHLRYVPNLGDNSDADVEITFSGTLLETESGEQGATGGSLTVVVDAVADMPMDTDSKAIIKDANGDPRTSIKPGSEFEVNIKATFQDYGEDDPSDTSESHYIFISKEHLADLDGFPLGINLITNPDALEALFKALEKSDGSGGIHGGPGAAGDYFVLEVTNQYLQNNNGRLNLTLKAEAGQGNGAHQVEVKVVAVEHDGYLTDVRGGDGHDREITAENNVAVSDADFELEVHEFQPEKVKVVPESEWVFENDRSNGHQTYYPEGSNAGRDHGTLLIFTEGPGEGNVVSSITFEYPIPPNGSPNHDLIESSNPNVDITYDLSTPGVVQVTITAKDPMDSVGELRFVPGDNYENGDVDIAVTNVVISDPSLGVSTKTEPGYSDPDGEWGSGVAPGGENFHVNVDAVAQKPGVEIIGVDYDDDSAVMAGQPFTINGKVSFEDTFDGSEQHFILVEIRDGYYPDSITLTFNGITVTIPLDHYSADPAVTANYSLQKLITADDGQPHLFCKISVDEALSTLMGNQDLYRMDNIEMDVVYQTREWAEEGVSLHFGAVAAEDINMVREYDANFNITNNELPFDESLKEYCPDLVIDHPNNTAIAIDSDAVYIYWDSHDPDDVRFDREYVFENDRPADHLRQYPEAYPDPRYDLEPRPDPTEYIPDYLLPRDMNTFRDLGTATELVIPDNAVQVTISMNPNYDPGNGTFYFLPRSAWDSFASSSPADDSALDIYKVEMGIPKGQIPGEGGEYILVFIPSNENYDAPGHNEAGPSHADRDVHFDYEIVTNQYNADGKLTGNKRYVGEDEIIRVDAVANQADILQAGDLTSTDKFSLFGGAGRTSSFPLTVAFHDLDDTEDHYILAEAVVNFGFECNGYTYTPGDVDSIYTHIITHEDGSQTFVRYYKIPVDQSMIDPVTGEVTVMVNYVPLPGMPSNADYPTSDNLTYGALTEDKTCSRWDSTNPNDPLFVNRIGADGEYTYENNTSVIIRRGVENGDPEGYTKPGWDPQPGGPSGGSGGSSGGTGGGGGDQIIYWPGGPGGNWSDEFYGPGGGGSKTEYWGNGGPGGGKEYWTGGGGGGTTIWHLGGGGGGGTVQIGGPGGSGGPSYPSDGSGNDPWVVSYGRGLSMGWVFENSTPIGHTQAGQYNAILPTTVYVNCLNEYGNHQYNASYIEITVPGVTAQLIDEVNGRWVLTNAEPHPRGEFALFDCSTDPATPIPLSYVEDADGNRTYTIPAPGGYLPPGYQLFFMAAPDSLDTDFDLYVQWYDNSGQQMNGAGNLTVLVDGVAQWANFDLLDIEDNIVGVTGEDPRILLNVEVQVDFLDQDGSETNYVLVEKIPGVLALYVIGQDANGDDIYGEVKEVYLNGKTYMVIEPTAQEQADGIVNIKFSVNADLVSPLYLQDDIEYKGMTFTGMTIGIGTMTIEGNHGIEGNWEYTLGNNTSLNLQDDGLTIVISNVNAKGGDSTIYAKETADPDANLIHIDPDDPATALNLSMDDNDVLTSLIFTGLSGNGVLLYRDDNGNYHPVPTGTDVKDLYLEGRLYHKQDRYEDSDFHIRWTATVQDGLSSDSKVTISGVATIAVDAVALASEIHLFFPVQDKDAGTLTLTLGFDDFQSNEIHYAVVAPDLYRVLGKTAIVYDANGVGHQVEVETILDPNGKPYYAVKVDGYLDANGQVKVEFELHDLNLPGIEDIPLVTGGVSVEPNTGYHANDREWDLSDNWAINVEPTFPAKGEVQTTGLALDIREIVEDDQNGAAIRLLVGSMGENDVITQASLTFTLNNPSGSDGGFDDPAGTQIATIVYNGQCFKVLLDGNGKAVVDLDFGPGGFDASADFRIIWGVAHMQGGKLVIDSYNHAASGGLELSTDFTVVNDLSGLSKVLNGSDPDGVTLTGQADAGLGTGGDVTKIAGDDANSGDRIGAGADSVTVSVSASFEDIDGSESHFLFLEIPDGWQVLSPTGGTTETVNGVKYYRLEVSGTEANPSVDVTLMPPDGINRDVHLKTGSLSVEDNGDEAWADGRDVILHLSDVSATGLDVQAAPILEDHSFALTALGAADLIGNDGNDTLVSVTFTDLKGGSIVGPDGTPLAGPPITLTSEQLLSGDYLYRPADNYAGELDGLGRPLPIALTYDAVLGESDTGATKQIINQQLSVEVIPVADAPENISGQTDRNELGEVGSEHKAVLPLHLEASFEDVDGSEQHFFVLHVPDGVAVKNGPGYSVVALTQDELDALGDRFPAGGSLYKVVVDDNTLANVQLDVNLEITSTAYNGGDVTVVGGSSEMLKDGSHSYGFSDEQSVGMPAGLENEIFNLDPVAVPSAASMDTWRDVDKMTEGTVDMVGVDPDGDTVTVAGLDFGAASGTRETYDGRECWMVKGDHGTLRLFDDGSYRYDLDPGADGVAGTEVFSYVLTDGYGGRGQSEITITLTGDNNAPFADASSETMDSVRQEEVRGNVVFGDSDGDAVSVVSVNGVDTLTNFGTAENPIWGFEVRGDYGTIMVYQNQNGGWQYVYTLDPDHRGSTDMETFSFTVRDAYGLEASNTISIDLFNVNNDPTAEKGESGMDTLRDSDGVVAGSLAVSDPDGDEVRLDGVEGPNGPGAWGMDDNGDPAFVVQGEHGMLYLYPSEDGDAIRYRYVLTNPAAEGVDATETFTYTVDDGYLGTASNTITINLTNTNNAPVIEGDFLRDLDTYRTEGGVIEGSISFHDPDYNEDLGRYDLAELSGLAFGGVAGSGDGQGGFVVNGDHGSFRINADGSYTYTLNPDAVGVVGTETFTITVTDEYGKTTVKDIAVNLHSTNSDPTAEAAVSGLDSWRLGGVEGQAIIGDPDPGDTPRVTWLQDAVEVTMPDGRTALAATGMYGTLYVYEDGSYQYEFTGPGGTVDTDVFTFAVTDGHGGRTESTISINLTGDNENPVAEDGVGTLDTHSVPGISGQVVFYDTDYYMDGDTKVHDEVFLKGLSGPSGQTATPITENGKSGFVIDGEHGRLYLFEDGSYRYELTDNTPGLTGVENFTYLVTDLYGGSSNGSITIDLVNINQDPTASSSEETLDTWREGTVVAGSVILADADGDTVTVNAGAGPLGDGSWGQDDNGVPSLVIQGQHGILYLYQDGAYRYVLTDPAGVGGQEVFSFEVGDGYGGTAGNSITINLSNANTAPALGGDMEVVLGGNIQDYENGVLQTSGQFSWWDADGDAIASVTVGGQLLDPSGSLTLEGKYGTLVVQGDGSYTYTLKPGLDLMGIDDVDSFEIVATDEYGGAAPENLNIVLKPFSHAPECSDVNVNWAYSPSGAPATVVSGALAFTDVDLNYPDADEVLSLTVNGIDVPLDGRIQIAGEYGVLTIYADGRFSYQPDSGNLDQPYLEQFSYTVTDKAGNTADANLYIRLSDDAPEFPNTGDTEAGVFDPADAAFDPAALGACAGLLSEQDDDLFGSANPAGDMPEGAPWDAQAGSAYDSSGYGDGAESVWTVGSLPVGLGDILDTTSQEQLLFESLLGDGANPDADMPVGPLADYEIPQAVPAETGPADHAAEAAAWTGVPTDSGDQGQFELELKALFG